MKLVCFFFFLIIFCAILFWLVILEFVKFKIIEQLLVCLVELILDMNGEFKIMYFISSVCCITLQMANTFFFLKKKKFI